LLLGLCFGIFPLKTWGVTGPYVSVDTAHRKITITNDTSVKDYAVYTLEFDNKIKDLQVVRLTRAGSSYYLVMTRTNKKVRLILYDEQVNKISSKLINVIYHQKNWGYAKLSPKTIDNTKILEIKILKLNKNAKPLSLVLQRYTISPDQEQIFKRTEKKEENIVVPNVSDNDDDTASLKLLNYQRQASGLLPVKHNESLDAGCALHVEYLRLNDILTHGEDINKQGYTEEGAEAGMASDLAAQSNKKFANAIPLWFTAIYHRFPMIDNGLQGVGWAVSAQSNIGYYYKCLNVYGDKEYGVITVAGRAVDTTFYNVDNFEPIAFPGRGQIQVDPIFDSGESPDPIADFSGSYPVGQPISLTFSDNQTVSTMKISLKDNQGNNVTGYARVPNDPNDPNSIYQGNSVSFIAEQPLNNNTKYTVSVSGKVNNQDYQTSWKFTTW